MVGTVGRKKKDADRVNYNISRTIRTAVLKEADRVGWNEIDMIEDLLKYGLAAKAMLKDGGINYAEFTQKMDSIIEDARNERTEEKESDRDD
jgi:restriction endonuclease Mrr